MKFKLLLIILTPFLCFAQENEPNSKKKKRKSDFITLPNISYSPETSLILGFAGFYNNLWGTEEEANRTSSHEFYGQYTLKKQISYGMRSDNWFSSNINHLYILWDYNKYPFQYYPLGGNSPDNSESYTTKFFNGQIRYERKVITNLYAGLQLDARLEKVIEVEKDKILSKKTIRGSNGLNVFGIGPSVTYDSRDNTLYPTKGDYHQFKARHFNKKFGDQESFTIYDLDFRKYYTVNKLNHILALNIAYQFADSKDIPFQMLPGVGNEKTQRGYYEGRYRSSNRVVLKTEYRFPISNRFKASVFGSSSVVNSSLGKLFKSKIHPATGIGFRYRLGDNGMHIRVDFAYGGSFSPYVNVGEAF